MSFPTMSTNHLIGGEMPRPQTSSNFSGIYNNNYEIQPGSATSRDIQSALGLKPVNEAFKNIASKSQSRLYSMGNIGRRGLNNQTKHRNLLLNQKAATQMLHGTDAREKDQVIAHQFSQRAAADVGGQTKEVSDDTRQNKDLTDGFEQYGAMTERPSTLPQVD